VEQSGAFFFGLATSFFLALIPIALVCGVIFGIGWVIKILWGLGKPWQDSCLQPSRTSRPQHATPLPR